MQCFAPNSTMSNLFSKKDLTVISVESPGHCRDSIIHCSPMETSDKKIVNIKIIFMKIGEIDTIKEQFTADVLIEALWREPGISVESVTGRVNFDNFWDPNIHIENILMEQKDSGWMKSTAVLGSEVYVAQKRRIRGIFMEKLELENFPFDVQDLTVKLVSHYDSSKIEFRTEFLENRVNNDAFVDKQKWKLYTHVEVEIRDDCDIISSKLKHPSISYMCQVERRPGFFYWNVFLIMWGIATLSFTTFAVDNLSTHKRLQLTFTLVLTTVAFKYVVNQSLPKISYLTYADKYILFSLALLAFICIWHSVVPYLVTAHGLAHENYVILGFLGIYLIYHLFFIIVIWSKGFRKRRIVKQKEQQLKLKINLANRSFREDKIYIS